MIRNIVIIEDEKPNADRLIRLLSSLRPGININAVIDSVADAEIWFNENLPPDAVMMDVRLSDGLSFEIFDRVSIDCPIIFTTAYDQYAVRAFRFNSIDYLLKPIEQKELQSALEKVEHTQLPFKHSSLEGLKDFLHPKEYRNRFLLPYKDGYISLLVDEISFFYSEHKITRVKMKNGSENSVPQTLEELERQLNPKHFFRANRQFLIHVDSIEKVHNYFNGKLRVDIKSNAKIEIFVSRERASTFKNWLNF